MEKQEWKPFRNALTSQKEKSLTICLTFLSYISACSNSVQLVALHPIIISILFHHYRELIQLVSEVEHLEARIDKHRRLTIREEKEEEYLHLQRQSNLSEF